MNLAPQRVSHNLVLLEINVLSILEEPKSRGELLLKVSVWINKERNEDWVVAFQNSRQGWIFSA